MSSIVFDLQELKSRFLHSTTRTTRIIEIHRDFPLPFPRLLRSRIGIKNIFFIVGFLKLKVSCVRTRDQRLLSVQGQGATARTLSYEALESVDVLNLQIFNIQRRE